MRSMWKVALPVILLFVLQPAHAQMLGPLGMMWETNVTLTRADLDIIKADLASHIHNRGPGATVSWRNPDSGNSGSITLLKIAERQGRRCEQIEYRMSPPDKGYPSDRFVLTSCMQTDGSWKLS